MTQSLSLRMLGSILIALGSPLSTWAATVSLTPVYSASYSDAITGDNCSGMTISGGCTANGWDVDPGADIYASDIYERPTSQTFTLSGGEYVSIEYLAYLDLVSAQYGYTGDDTAATNDDYMYFQLTMFSPYLYKNDGTVDTGVFGSGTYYNVQLGSTDADDGQLLLRAEQDKSTVDAVVDSSFPLFDSSKTQGFYDTNDSVAGPGGVGTPDEEGAIADFDGYEDQAILTDGYLPNGQYVLYSRSFYNADGTVSVELAFNYYQYNLYCATSSLCSPIDPTSLPYLVFETDRGVKDNSKYLWNDKYNATEAGSPYAAGKLENLYELDNLRAGYSEEEIPPAVVPEPATLLLLGTGLGAVAVRRRMRAKKHA